MTKLIIGLGNPEQKYTDSPHNLGRELVEFLQESKRFKWKKEKLFDWTDSSPSYLRSNTYMNLSGEAVKAALRKFNSGPEEILICCDDLSLPLGAIRLRKKGSAGSHNGLKSVIEHLETDQFPRLRLGVGPVPDGQDWSAFVLKPFPQSKQKTVQEMLRTATTAVEVVVTQGLESAMNLFNKKTESI